MDALVPARGTSPPLVAALTALFNTHVRPSTLDQRTWLKAWLGWRAVLSLATVHRCLHSILPMDRQTLHCMLWELVQLQCLFPVIKGVITCIQSQHRFFRLTFPISAAGDYTSLTVMLSLFQGLQWKITFPMHRDLVVELLSINTPSLAVRRNCLAGALCSMCLMLM